MLALVTPPADASPEMTPSPVVSSSPSNAVAAPPPNLDESSVTAVCDGPSVLNPVWIKQSKAEGGEYLSSVLRVDTFVHGDFFPLRGSATRPFVPPLLSASEAITLDALLHPPSDASGVAVQSLPSHTVRVKRSRSAFSASSSISSHPAASAEVACDSDARDDQEQGVSHAAGQSWRMLRPVSVLRFSSEPDRLRLVEDDSLLIDNSALVLFAPS